MRRGYGVWIKILLKQKITIDINKVKVYNQ